MTEDFDEFSALVINPGDRLKIKRFITKQIASESSLDKVATKLFLMHYIFVLTKVNVHRATVNL